MRSLLGLVVVGSAACVIEERQVPLRHASDDDGDTHALVVANADAVLEASLVMWSRALPPAHELAPRTARATGEARRARGAAATSGDHADVDEPPGQGGAPVPSTPPRSASEAAERPRESPGTAPPSNPATPDPVSPTAPAETQSPLRR